MKNFKANTLYDLNLQKVVGLTILLAGMSVYSVGCESLPGPTIADPGNTEVSSPEAGQSDPDATPGKEQKVGKSYRFTDVPVPAKFKIVRDKTFIYEAGSFKAGIITYVGWAKLDALAGFYKKNMPEYDWEMVSIFEHDDVTMVYSKEGWSCTVHLTAGKIRGSRIRIQIGPLETP